MTDALSRHADEILAQCVGKELAVEQAFRALSEVDREGRAIRRALRFDKLLAETGVSESDLRAGLDRFRAPNCSFLLPSLSVSPTLAADERIDIGHEALLRRWKTIAGKTEPVDPKTGRPPPGWLAEEQIDGQRYHTLVSLLDGAAGGERATLDDPERTKEWWGRLPRTAAWADRYGGKFELVKKRIDDAIEAKRRSRRNRRLVAALGVAASSSQAVDWAAHERAQQRHSPRRERQEEARQERDEVGEDAAGECPRQLTMTRASTSPAPKALRPYRDNSSMTPGQRGRPPQPISYGVRRSTSTPTFKRRLTNIAGARSGAAGERSRIVARRRPTPNAREPLQVLFDASDPRRQRALPPLERPLAGRSSGIRRGRSRSRRKSSL